MKKFRIQENDSRIPAGWKGKGFSKFELCLLNKGELLIKKEEKQDVVYWVVSGFCAAVIVGQDGKMIVLNIFGKNTMVGELEVLTNNSATCNIMALGSVTAVAVPIKEYTEKAKTDIDLLRLVSESTANGLTMQIKRLTDSVLLTARQRICRRILQIEKDGVFAANMVIFAAYIGVDYRHVTKIMKKLCDEEILRKEGRSVYRIINRDLLEENC